MSNTRFESFKPSSIYAPTSTRFAKPAMFYDVVLFDDITNEPFIGCVVTNLSLEAWCIDNNKRMGVVHCRRPAKQGEQTSLI